LSTAVHLVSWKGGDLPSLLCTRFNPRSFQLSGIGATGISPQPKRSYRRGDISMMLQDGAPITYVSRQLGNRGQSIKLRV
jgi:hypothetical protein